MGRYKVDYEAGDLIPLEEVMVGATSSIAGNGGIVPAPQAGQQNHYCKGNGTWDRSEIDDIENVYGAKNLIAFPYEEGGVGTYYDGKVTINADGSVLVNGSFTEECRILCSIRSAAKTKLINGQYILSGCPEGGGSGKYMLRFQYTKADGTPTSVDQDKGNKAYFTINENQDYTPISIWILIYAGYTADNLLFQPMLRIRSIASDTFVPYAKTNLELTRNLQDATTVTEITDSAPYLYRASKGGDRQYDELVGGSVVWNQTAPAMSSSSWKANGCSKTYDATTDIITATPSNYSSDAIGIYASCEVGKIDHKFLVFASIYPSHDVNFRVRVSSQNKILKDITGGQWNKVEGVLSATGTENNMSLYCALNMAGWSDGTIQYKEINVFDLTAMFGSTIADYIYAREIAETGSGIAWIKSYGFFGKDYYAYDTGSILSVNTSGHKLEGKNIFNPDTMTQTNYKDGVGVRDGNLYTITVPSGFSNNSGIYLTWASGTKAKYSIFPRLKLIFEYKGNGAFDCGFGMNGTSTTAASTTTDWKTFEQTINESSLNTIKFYIKNTVSGAHTLYVKNIMVTTADAENRYVPYVDPITYPLTSTDLRGTLSLSGDDLVYDGDVYKSNGTETVKYGIVDLGTLDWIYTSNNGGYFYTADGTILQGNKKDNALVCDKYIYGGWNNTNSYMANLPDKSVIKRFNASDKAIDIRVKDSSYTDAATFKTAMNGVYCIYELPTPTTATLSPFVSPQICDKDGTEEYIDTRAVPMPVGHYTEYYGVPEWLRDRYLDELRAYPYEANEKIDFLSKNVILPINPTAAQISAYANGTLWIETE